MFNNPIEYQKLAQPLQSPTYTPLTRASRKPSNIQTVSDDMFDRSKTILTPPTNVGVEPLRPPRALLPDYRTITLPEVEKVYTPPTKPIEPIVTMPKRIIETLEPKTNVTVSNDASIISDKPVLEIGSRRRVSHDIANLTDKTNSVTSVFGRNKTLLVKEADSGLINNDAKLPVMGNATREIVDTTTKPEITSNPEQAVVAGHSNWLVILAIAGIALSAMFVRGSSNA